ncbi:MAG: malto-oligosyltrehalose trehalohydrolase [Verrucomicrobiota bacterium]|nr:malto-oligosyltrehalose trehalohydrolase [Verrucomicrobiota bacterium]
MNISDRSQGADCLPGGGVRYRTWAPGKEVTVVISNARADLRRVRLEEIEGGYRSAIDREGRAGDRYKYRFEGNDWPDPASRFNPEGVHGPAEVIDPRSYAWSHDGWVAPPLSELVIYEVHIGTFTPAGTFRGALEKLDHLAALGVNAIEIMPVADFPGERNWGYDGVLLYAPARVYGSPNDLRSLIDAAHGRGLTVILDVVYNHLGPDGNYLGCYSREYFNPTHKTPWGDGFNFELQPVRDFFVGNAAYWRREFHVDGFRLDATHAIADGSEKHVLAEIAERVQSSGGFVIAEDERNEAALLRPREKGGLGLDAIWSDDFHHVVRVMLTGMREGYYRSYRGTIDELAATLDHGWLLAGKKRAPQGLGRLGETEDLRPEQFVFCITNHDQVGNQAFGLRLNQLISPAAFRAASALLCLAPYTPLIFMGQEWAASAPFLFFTDHNPELGRKVTEGRREEFRSFSDFRDPEARTGIPDPQARETFLGSKLDWKETAAERHAGVLRLYRECLRLRRESPQLRDRSRGNFEVLPPLGGVLRVSFGRAEAERWLLLADLTGGHRMPPLEDESSWELVLSTNETRFGGEAGPAFAQPEVRVLRLTRAG